MPPAWHAWCRGVVEPTWADRFPELFRPRYEDYANADVEFRIGTPPDELESLTELVRRELIEEAGCTPPR